MMKKTILVPLLLPVLMAGTFSVYADDPVAPTPVSIDGGKINFTGAVVASPCAVDNSSDGQSVNLGQISTSLLASKGATGSSVPFTIKLVGCELSPQADAPEGTSNYTKASIKFMGTTIDSTTLAVTATGAGQVPAKNVGIQISQSNEAVTVDGSTNTASQTIIANENEIPFTATYVATDANVTAGQANGSVNFQVNYE